MQTILVHFDVSHEYVLLETFVASANAAQRTVNALNQVYFGGQAQLEIVVLPPEGGTLKQYIGVVLKTIGGGIVTLSALAVLLETEHGEAVFEELSGKTSSEIVRTQVREWKQKYESIFTENEQEVEVYDKMDDDRLLEEGRNLIEEIVTRTASYTLEMPRTDLEKSRLPEDQKFEIAEAQSELFSQALNDPNIRGIGFSEDDDFPIPRSSFAERGVRPTQPREPEPDEDWIVSLRTVRVTSPNFEKDDQTNRKWKGRLDTGSHILFEVVDEEFWLKLKRSEIEFGESTVVKVQLATRIEDGKVRNHKAVRVLSIDDIDLASPLTDESLAAELGSYSYQTNKPGTPDLFA